MKEVEPCGTKVNVGTIWRLETASALPPKPQPARHKLANGTLSRARGTRTRRLIRWRNVFLTCFPGLTRETVTPSAARERKMLVVPREQIRWGMENGNRNGNRNRNRNRKIGLSPSRISEHVLRICTRDRVVDSTSNSDQESKAFVLLLHYQDREQDELISHGAS